MDKTINIIAIMAHEANRAYCKAIGDNSQLPWRDAPEWQRESARNGVTFHVNTYQSTGKWPEPEDSHKSWLKEKEKDGWKWGRVKDAESKTHPCFIPYAQLPVEQRAKDYIFGSVVKNYYMLHFPDC